MNLASKLQSLMENDLTRRVLVPLFKALGYHSVEFYGGPSEEGKDLVAWRVGEVGELNLAIVQVKRMRPRKRLTSSESFARLVDQLEVAAEAALPYKDGTLHHPTRVYFVTPYPVETSAIKSRFDKFSTLRSRGVQIIDGPKLCELVERHIPKIAEELYGTLFTVGTLIAKSLTNEVLLRALELESGRAVASFFTDIDFSFGKASLEALFSDICPKSGKVSLPGTTWPEIQNLSQSIKNSFNCELFKGDEEVLKKKVNQYSLKYNEWNLNHSPLIERLRSIEKRNATTEGLLTTLHASIDPNFQGSFYFNPSDISRPFEFLQAVYDSPKDHLVAQFILQSLSEETQQLIHEPSNCEARLSARLAQDLNSVLFEPIEKPSQSLAEIFRAKEEKSDSKWDEKDWHHRQVKENHTDSPESECLDENSKSPLLNKLLENRWRIAAAFPTFITTCERTKEMLISFRKYVDETEERFSKEIALHNRLKKAAERSASREPKSISVELHGEDLQRQLLDKRSQLLDKIKQLNRKSSKRGLKELFNDCMLLSNGIEHLRRYKEIATMLGFTQKISRSLPKSSTRIEVSVLDALGSGKNLTVIGDAGAGKTTALMMYAAMLLSETPQERIVIFAPLARVISSIKERTYLEWDSNRLPPVERLVDMLFIHLTEIGASLTEEQLRSEIREKGAVLLLDGIDEVYQRIPWICDAITGLSTMSTKIQIVTSSREIGTYVDELPFLTIKILEFTHPQRELFIRKWFGEAKRKSADAVIEHLRANKEIAEIVKLPLLATILCVLAQSGIQLPHTEVRLFDERLKLLVGYYDLHKRVKRLTRSTAQLELVAQKLAFAMHLKKSRTIAMTEASTLAIKALKGELLETEAAKAVEELIDPCNVLLRTQEDGSLTLGHLRFQEHLAAREISRNRGINIIALMKDPYWRDTFVLFAKSDPEIESLIDSMLHNWVRNDVRETLLAMAQVCSSEKRARFIRELGRESTSNWVEDPNESLHWGTPLGERLLAEAETRANPRGKRK